MNTLDLNLIQIERYAEEMEHGVETAALDDALGRAALGYARRLLRLSETGEHDPHQTRGGLIALQRVVETARLTPRYPDAPWGPAA